MERNAANAVSRCCWGFLALALCCQAQREQWLRYCVMPAARDYLGDVRWGSMAVQLEAPDGVAMPELSGKRTFFTRWESPVAKAGHLLVCFWDREQRPSRRCVTGLAQLAGELRRAGFTPVAVDVCVPLSDLPSRQFPFASGHVVSSPELLETWGIRGLPWLIVADAAGVVTRDGLSLADVRSLLEGAAPE